MATWVQCTIERMIGGWGGGVGPREGEGQGKHLEGGVMLAYFIVCLCVFVFVCIFAMRVYFLCVCACQCFLHLALPLFVSTLSPAFDCHSASPHSIHRPASIRRHHTHDREELGQSPLPVGWRWSSGY